MWPAKKWQSQVLNADSPALATSLHFFHQLNEVLNKTIALPSFPHFLLFLLITVVIIVFSFFSGFLCHLIFYIWGD
jgi:hypothetical protein